MGIKKLRKIAHEILFKALPAGEDEVQAEVPANWIATSEFLPDGSVLLVDAYAFMFHVANGTENFRPELGGDMKAFDKALTETILKFRELGLGLTVILDGGNKPHYKDSEAASRRRDKDRKWNDLYRYCQDSTEVYSPNIESVFHFTYLQFRCTLAQLNVEVITANGEAELEIVRRVRIHNALAGRETHFAYSGDSDFMAMCDCPYIEVGTIFEGEGRAFAKHIFRLPATAASFGLSERMFVEYCIAMGNDFTKHSSKALMRLSPREPLNGRISNSRFLDYFKGLIQDKGEFDLISLDEDIEERIQYSRHFYGASGHEEDPAIVVPEDMQLLDDIAEDDFRVLRPNQIEIILAYIEEATVHEIPLILVDLLQHEDLARGLISETQVEAFREMVEMVDASDVDLSVQRTLEELHNVEITSPLWKNVVAVNRFQNIYATILEKFGYSSVATSPSRIFDGHAFHAIMKQKGEEAIGHHFELAEEHSQPRIYSPSMLDRTLKARNVAAVEINFPRLSASWRMSEMLSEIAPPFCISSEYCEAQADVTGYLVRAHAVLGKGILVFVDDYPSSFMIEQVLQSTSKFQIVKFNAYGSTPAELEALKTTPPAEDKVKVILWKSDFSPAGRKSVTITYVSCVIDLCQTMKRTSDEKFLYQTSQNSCNQRLGASGRLRDIVRYSLVRREGMKISEFPQSLTITAFQGYFNLPSQAAMESSVAVALGRISIAQLRDKQRVPKPYAFVQGITFVNFSNQASVDRLAVDGEISTPQGWMCVDYARPKMNPAHAGHHHQQQPIQDLDAAAADITGKIRVKLAAGVGHATGMSERYKRDITERQVFDADTLVDSELRSISVMSEEELEEYATQIYVYPKELDDGGGGVDVYEDGDDEEGVYVYHKRP